MIDFSNIDLRFKNLKSGWGKLTKKLHIKVCAKTGFLFIMALT